MTPEPTQTDAAPPTVDPDGPDALINRELSWLGFAGRVLSLAGSPELPLLERVKFVGIMGMLHDEFFMKRISGMKRRIAQGRQGTAPDGMTASQEYAASRTKILDQIGILSGILRDEILPGLAREGIPILDAKSLDAEHRDSLRRTFRESILPVLTPLAVDAEHPFPFISNQGLNLAVRLPGPSSDRLRFVRIKVPDNRPRWVPVPGTRGFIPMEQVIASNLDLMFPATPPESVHFFRVTRSAEGHPERSPELEVDDAFVEPGLIVRLVADELKARRFAECVRLQVDDSMSKDLRTWLARQFGLSDEDVYQQDHLLGINDLLKISPEGADHLKLPPHQPNTHPRLRNLEPRDTGAIFEEIRRGDILLHHPYDSFDTSVLRFLESAARDPNVLAIKLTIYRTSSDSPIVQALLDAARRHKQVAVLVEITARFDEAPNIAWGKLLEEEGVHVSYGVEHLKTHVKLALVVREEGNALRRYVHVGTGNYHSGTARVYEDLGMLTSNAEITADAAAVFNALTGSTAQDGYRRLLVAPRFLRERWVELIRREAGHAEAGRPAGIVAKMNQLQDPEMIRELYRASQAGVSITLIVRGLCCLRPGVPGLSENTRVLSVVGRFLEHSRIYRFENGGSPEFFIGSADWMHRNLDRRVETISPVLDAGAAEDLEDILAVYFSDNASAWDGQPDGSYVRRTPAEGEERREAQEIFIRRARERA